MNKIMKMNRKKNCLEIGYHLAGFFIQFFYIPPSNVYHFIEPGICFRPLR